MMKAQGVGNWKSYMSYYNTTMVVETPNKVFGVAIPAPAEPAQGVISVASLYSYSPEDNEIKTYSKSDGLNDISVNQIKYDNQTKSLIIAYDNCNIDILTNSGIFNISSIKDINTTLNNIEIYEQYAYLSAGFGIVVIDLQKKEIKDVYRFEKNTYSVCFQGDYIYAATEEGIFRALKSLNLLDKQNWNYYPLSHPDLNDKNIKKILLFKNQFTFAQYDSGIFYLDDNNTVNKVASGYFKKVDFINEQLVSIEYPTITFYHDFTTKDIVSNLTISDISSLGQSDTYWTAQGTNGIISIKKESGSNSFETVKKDLTINSPKRNLIYYMTFSHNKLLIVGGGRWASRFNYPGTLMVMENDSWFNFDEQKISSQAGTQCLDFTSVAVDPRDVNHYFVTSYGEGVYEFKDNNFVKLYNYSNSTLQTIYPDNNHYIRMTGLAYDKNNNLYMANTQVRNSIQILKSDQNWIGHAYNDMDNKGTIGDILITKNNQKWVNIPRSGPGIFVFDDKGTIDDTTDDRSYFFSSFRDQNGETPDASGYLCMAEDKNGIIWVGTDQGPILFNNPLKALDDTPNFTCYRIVVPYEEGGTEGYHMLGGEQINAIAIDGANRKWIGTDISGVYLLDETGKKIIHNFTVDNSPLISNKINTITINDKTGEVFIGTDKGLVSYISDAIEGKPDYSNVYAYPNPVRPEFDNQVVITGLIKDSNVKITDLKGNLMYQGTSVGGQFIWNCTKSSGGRVNTGVYLVLAATSDGGEGVVTKILVVK